MSDSDPEMPKESVQGGRAANQSELPLETKNPLPLVAGLREMASPSFGMAAQTAAGASRNQLLPASDTAFHIGQLAITVRQGELIAVLLLTTAAAFLLFKNLGDQYLWQDEAQTALLARTILTDGFPRGYEGENCLSQEYGIELWGKFPFVYRWHTWLSFYAVAAGLAIFGPTSTFGARFPCALFGLAAVPLTYYFARSLWQSRRAALLATALLIANVPFLILARQCRYYSACIFFMLLALWAYDRLVQRKRWAAFWFVAASFLLFHSFYIYWGILLASVLVDAVVFHRDRLWTVAKCSILSLILVSPWLLWYFWPGDAAVYKDTITDASWTAMLHRQFSTLWRYVYELCVYGFAPCLCHLPVRFFWPTVSVMLLLVVGGGLMWHYKFGGQSLWLDAVTRRGCAFLILIAAVNVLLLTVATPAYFFRYIAPLVPLMCILAGRAVEAAMRLRISLGVILLAPMLLAGQMPDYLFEITHHLYTPSEAMVEYLNKHAAPGDKAAISYGDLPLKFYTKLRVVAGTTGEDPSLADDARWVILRRKTVCVRKRDIVMPKHLYNLIMNHPHSFQAVQLECFDTLFDNREAPQLHRFWTAREDEDGVKGGTALPVLIQKRIGGNPVSPLRQPSETPHLLEAK